MDSATQRAVGCSALGVAVLFAALVAIRFRLVEDVGAPLAIAWHLGLGIGLVTDFVTAVFPAAVALIVWRLAPRAAFVAWGVLAFVVWGFATANAVYFSYFGTRLELWVVASHTSDLPTVRHSIMPLVGARILAFGVAIVLAACIAALVASRRAPSAAPLDVRARASRIGAVALGIALVALVGLTGLKRTVGDGSAILAEQVFASWVETAFNIRRHTPLTRRGMERVLGDIATLDPVVPATVLAALRDGKLENEPVPDQRAPADAKWPLYVERTVDPALTSELRRKLGLPPEGRINIIVLFLESVRAFEYLHPEIGPLIFPELRNVVAKHGLAFPVAYASATDAGETVQGQLATLCSMLPNTDGPPAYIAYPHLRIRCLQELLKEHGYATTWISGGYKNFHNKYVFESLHGTESFVDADDFAQIGPDHSVTDCGFPDGPMLLRSVELLSKLAHGPKPFFVNMLTLSTHHPVSVIPEGPVPESLARLAKAPPSGKDYLGYLSRLRYLDKSLGAFFAALFREDWADRTLVVVLGDHGKQYKPHLELGPWGMMEAYSRIPLAFVTKNMREPGIFAGQVHQIDLAPSIADVAGVSGRVTWLGRSVWSGRGSPWVLGDQGHLHYRLGDHACYTLSDRFRCFALEEGTDPLFSTSLPAIDIDSKERNRFQHVIDAARNAITLNLIAPPRSKAGDLDPHASSLLP
jgi:phosphoglycerol transferase MdoB-like AlkP superfamily enzyme